MLDRGLYIVYRILLYNYTDHTRCIAPPGTERRPTCDARGVPKAKANRQQKEAVQLKAFLQVHSTYSSNKGMDFRLVCIIVCLLVFRYWR